MRIYIGQIYIEPGVDFPFSHHFQLWLSNALSERVEVTESFIRAFGSDFSLGIRMSARDDLDEPELRGPSVFKRDKDVEFSVFLPHRPLDYRDLQEASLVVEQLLRSIVLVLDRLGLDSAKVVDDIPILVAEFAAKPEFFEG